MYDSRSPQQTSPTHGQGFGASAQPPYQFQATPNSQLAQMPQSGPDVPQQFMSLPTPASQPGQAPSQFEQQVATQGLGTITGLEHAVNIAIQTVEKTKNNPYDQARDIAAIKNSYIKERFGLQIEES